MKIYLAGSYSRKPFFKEIEVKYLLESYQYIKSGVPDYITNMDNFLLDSGAFTFMSKKSKGNKINWENYIKEYAKFILKNKVKLFFELDIDVIVGIEEVRRLRAMLEDYTGMKCIPVWHRDRGLESRAQPLLPLAIQVYLMKKPLS